MDIRTKTCLVIRKGNEFLVGRIIVSGELNWSNSYYDAFRTRNISKARYLAKRYGGVLMLFNPIVGQIREYA